MHINVDLDNLWIYEGEYGTPATGAYDELFHTSLPRMLEIFDRFQVKATLFVVGKDLERESCQKFIADAARRGHEIANHSYSHPPNFMTMPLAEKEAEIMRCHELILKVTGKAPVGFRGPGYYLDRDIIEILVREGYRYDSSVLPSFANQLMALRVFLKTGRWTDKVYGLKRFMFASQDPTRIESRVQPEKYLIELPITTAPYFRWPIHTTYLYMFGFWYFDKIASLIDKIVRPIYLLHAIDTHQYTPGGPLAKSVLPFAKTLESRIELLEKVLTKFSHRRYTTNREGVETLTGASLPRSWLFS